MTALAKPLPPGMTVDEFLAWPGDGTGTIYELVDGQLRAQEAPSDTHGTIHGNIVRLLSNHIIQNGLPCRTVVGGGVRPRLLANWNFRIPDVAVTCTPNSASGHDIPDPKLVIELLSKSNEQDTWDNIRNYVTLPSVVEIVLISTLRGEAHILRRDAQGDWPKNPLEIGREGPIQLASIGLEMAMADVYWGTHLAGRVG